MASGKTFSRRGLAAGALAGLTAGAIPAASAAEPSQGWFDVTRYGAAAGSAGLATAKLQAAIDACAQAGGGFVYFPPGRYTTGTLALRDHVRLLLAPGATISGSRSLADYTIHKPRIRTYTENYTERSLIYAEGATGIGILGAGTIDGQGEAFAGPYKARPYMIRMVGCRDVTVQGVTLKDSAMWVQHYLACRDVQVTGVRVRSLREDVNNDGIDVDSCERFRISDCDIEAGDDAIVLKSTAEQPCRDIVVTNCVLRSLCNAIKIGTESNGDFEDIAVSNCVVRDTRLAGIALESVDGGNLRRVQVQGITMRNVGCPIFVRLGHRARPVFEGGRTPGRGSLRDVIIRDVQAVATDEIACSITGLPGQPAGDITLESIRLRAPGGGREPREPVQERADSYPEYKIFGPLPAFGFYCRHVRNLALRDIEVACLKAEARPAVHVEDGEGIRLERIAAAPRSREVAAVRLMDVRRATVRDLETDGAPGRLEVHGAGSRAIAVARSPFAREDDVIGPGVDAAQVKYV